MSNGQFRAKKIYFSQVSNSALRDSNLSLKAKGLYALIQSYITIENFTLYKTTLKKQCQEGEKAFDAAWKELKDKGYLIQYRLQGDKGAFYYEYELLDEAEPLKNKDVIHTPKKEGVGCVVGGKRGVYNNTNLNNNDLNNTNISTTDTAKAAVVATDNELIILKDTNIKTLTVHQKKKVSAWEVSTLIKAIAIYNQLGGQYFKLLEKIYNDGAKDSLIKKPSTLESKNPTFTNTYSHNWDLDQLDELAQEYMERELRGGK